MGSVSIKNIDEPGGLKDQDEVRLRNKALNLSVAGPLTMHGSLITLEDSESIYYIEGLGTLYGKDGWHFVYGKREVPEWEPGTVCEITTRDDDTVDAWCITGASPGHVVFLDQDGEEYDPSELLAITPQTSVDFTVAALRAEVSKLQTVINITDQAGADILDERNELLAEVERLRATRKPPTREQVESMLRCYSTTITRPGTGDFGAIDDYASRFIALFEQGGAAHG